MGEHTTSLVRYELAGAAARITLTAAERGNPLDPQMVGELLRAVRRARADDVRVVLLRGFHVLRGVVTRAVARAGRDDGTRVVIAMDQRASNLALGSDDSG